MERRETNSPGAQLRQRAKQRSGLYVNRDCTARDGSSDRRDSPLRRHTRENRRAFARRCNRTKSPTSVQKTQDRPTCQSSAREVFAARRAPTRRTKTTISCAAQTRFREESHSACRG